MGKVDNLRNRLHIAGGEAPSDRPPCIPESVLRRRAGEEMAVDEEERQEKLEKDRMEELGGAGVYSVDLWRKALLEDDSWKYDMVPEIMDGRNVVDFIDPDIDKKLADLEKEEALLMQEAGLRDDDQVLDKFRKTQGLLDEVHSRIRQRRLESRLAKTRNHVPTPRKAKKRGKEVENLLRSEGLDSDKAKTVAAVVRGRSASRKKPDSLLGKRKRDATTGAEDGDRGASMARARSMSRLKGLPNEETAQAVERLRRKKMRLHEKQGKKGEADKHIPDLKPKHLFTGKRGIGKTDRR